MTQATDITKKANLVLSTFKKSKKAKTEAVEDNENPLAVATRHGVLVPWGGAMSGGASQRKTHG